MAPSKLHRLAIACCCSIIASTALSCIRASDPEPLNVLFIVVDDLRPELGSYGHPQVQSPNIDRLAAEGTLFTRAYSQQAVCNPARASLLTGLRPESTGITDLQTFFREKRPDAVTLPQYFKQHGYHTQGIGKVFHTGHGNRDDDRSWSVQERFELAPRSGPGGEIHVRKQRQEAISAGLDPDLPENRPRPLPWDAPEVEDDELYDGSVARNAIELIRKHQHEPFFVAVGFKNPHLPFVAPKEYWDLYERSTIDLADNPTPPSGSPTVAHTNSGELRRYFGIPASGPLSDEKAREAIHGYWAAVSYVDALVGSLLDELDRLDLRKKTVVILWSDQGWHLGDHGFWGKHTNYESAVRVPLIISVPDQPNAGARSDRLVELVDVFPTLADVVGLTIPDGLEGTSFRPLIEEPDRSWKNAVFHLYSRNPGRNREITGRAIRTESHRLVEWTTRTPNKRIVERELYDLRNDPDENSNLAHEEGSRLILDELTERLREGWRGARPEHTK